MPHVKPLPHIERQEVEKPDKEYFLLDRFGIYLVILFAGMFGGFLAVAFWLLVLLFIDGLRVTFI